jgi:hypothetical protein
MRACSQSAEDQPGMPGRRSRFHARTRQSGFPLPLPRRRLADPAWSDDCGEPASLGRPAAQDEIKALIARGFHKPGDVENRLGYHLGQLAHATRSLAHSGEDVSISDPSLFSAPKWNALYFKISDYFRPVVSAPAHLRQTAPCPSRRADVNINFGWGLWLALSCRCSDGFEIGCDNGERVRVAFTLQGRRHRADRRGQPGAVHGRHPDNEAHSTILGAVAEFDKAMIVAKLRGARDRKRAGNCMAWGEHRGGQP